MVYPVSEETTSKITPRQLMLKLAFILLATLCAVGLVILYAPKRAVSSILAALVLMAVVALVVSILGYLSQPSATDQGKRDLEKTNTHVMIDQMVAHLNTGEVAYLQRQIDQREVNRKDEISLAG